MELTNEIEVDPTTTAKPTECPMLKTVLTVHPQPQEQGESFKVEEHHWTLKQELRTHRQMQAAVKKWKPLIKQKIHFNKKTKPLKNLQKTKLEGGSSSLSQHDQEQEN